MTQSTFPGSQPQTSATLQLPAVGDGSAGWLVSVALVLAGGFMWLRRRVSRDNTEIVKDRAEGTMLQIALHERDKAMADAREAWKQRTSDAQEIAGLRAKNNYLEEEVTRLRGDIQRANGYLAQVLQAMRTMNPEFQLVPIDATGLPEVG